MNIRDFFLKVADFFVDLFKEPLTWRGVIVLGSVIFGFNFDAETQLAIVSIGVAIASSIDILPDNWILRKNNKQIEDTVQNKVQQNVQDVIRQQLENMINKKLEDMAVESASRREAPVALYSNEVHDGDQLGKAVMDTIDSMDAPTVSRVVYDSDNSDGGDLNTKHNVL